MIDSLGFPDKKLIVLYCLLSASYKIEPMFLSKFMRDYIKKGLVLCVRIDFKSHFNGF